VYVDSIFDNQLTIVNAKAGTGKTTLAIAAAKLLGKDLIYCFAPVEEDKLGHTPGSLSEKEKKYYQPLIDGLYEINEDPSKVIYNEEDMENLKAGNVWVYPKSHVFLRGTNIKNKVLIIDECQNFTRSDLKKVLTRVAKDTKVIMIGHEFQCDLKDPRKSGFKPYLEHFEGQPYANVCTLSKNYRSELANWADELKW
jgi:predicted ribonuclease YlaK